MAVSKMMDVSRLSENVNGSARTTPITSPSPGMMDTAMPIRRPMPSATRSCHLNTSAKPASRRCMLSTSCLSAHAYERHDQQRDLFERPLPKRQCDEDQFHEHEAQENRQQNCQDRDVTGPAETAQPHQASRVDHGRERKAAVVEDE